MKFKILVVFTVLGFILGGCASKKITREEFEWSDFWKEHEPDITKPRVLFIGNSISRAYFPLLSKKLSGKVNCDRYSTSRSIEDPVLLEETRLAIGNYNHAVIHFNNGLHGWHLNKEQYRKGLERYVKFLRAHKSKNCILVYSLTTPVSSSGPGQKLDPVRNKTVMERNEVAREIMTKNGIPVIDLYGLMEPELDKYVASKGDLHYKGAGYQLMADLISREILNLIKL
ncbi:MAG: SGNH/GDSL hydrolase family protein [Mangrovibacterium sp.]